MSTPPTNLFYEFGPFRLDTREHRLLRNGEVVALTPKAVDTLRVLIEHRGQLVERNELMKSVWGDVTVEDGNLSVAVSMLRKVLGADLNIEKFIETIPKRGYKFVAQVHEVAEEVPALVVDRRTVSRLVIDEEIGFGRRGKVKTDWRLLQSPRHRLSALALAAGLVVVVGGALAYFLPWKSSETNASAVSIRSIAVLPLKSFTPDAGSEPLRLRITDALITRLAGLKDVRVRPTSSVLRFAGEGQDLIEAGKMLGVDAILEGRVQLENDRLRVTLQLVSVRDGEQLWAEQIDGHAGEILALQDTIANSLRQKFALAENRNAGRRPTENNEAYEAYLKGRYLWNQRTAAAYWKALDYFQQSVASDKNFALAYAGIADCYILLEQREVLPANEAFQKAEDAARKALELDSTIAEAHTSMGLIAYLSRRDWIAAESHFTKAIELNPNYSGGHAQYGMFLNAWGRFDEAFARLKEAEKLDPTSLNIGIYLGANFYFSKQFERAIAQFNRVLEFAPGTSTSYFYLTRIYELNGQFDEAVEAELKRRVTSNPESIEPLRAAYQAGGIRGFWQKQIELLKAKSKNEPGLDHHIASRYALLGEAENALAYIKKNQTARGSMWTALKVDPSFESLRTNSKFQELANQMTPSK